MGRNLQGWHDLKVGVWFETDVTPPDTPEEQWDIRATNITYYCNFVEAKEFGKLLWATGFQRKALEASERIFLGDGAEWIWNLVHNHYPQGVQIVDWFHAAKRLGDVAKAAFEEPDQRKRWRERARQHLWGGPSRARDPNVRRLGGRAGERCGPGCTVLPQQ